MQGEESTNYTRLAVLTLAFSMLTVTTLLMNSRLFPLIDGGFPYARETCVGVYAVVLVVMGLLCARTRMDKISRAFDVLAFYLPVLGLFIMIAGFVVANVHILAAGAVIASMGRAMVVMYVGISMAVMPHFDIVVAVAIGYLVQRVASFAFPFIPEFFVIFLFAALPLCALGLAYSTSKSVFAEIRVAHSASELSATNPFSFVPLKSLFMVSLFVYQLVFGFSMRFGDVPGVVAHDSWVIIPLAILVVLAALKTRRPTADDLNDLAVLVVIGAFLVILVGWEGSIPTSMSLLAIGSTVFNIVAWVALLGLTSRNHIAAPAVIGFGRGICSIGSITGAQIGIATNSYVASQPEMANVVAASMVLILVVYSFLVMRHFSFSGTAAGLAPMQIPVEGEQAAPAVAQEGVAAVSEVQVSENKPVSAVPQAAPTSAAQILQEDPEALRKGFDDRCMALAVQHGLTEREKEVFLLLARGRNRDYIQDALFISKNTVKVHVKHIYQKMDVHSHQELIDLVVSKL